MLGYASALGFDLKLMWTRQFLPMIDMFIDSSYFLPVVVAAVVILVLGAKILSK